MFDPLDPLLHSQLRLAIMSLLMNVEEAEFNYIKEKAGASSGNLSVQLNKLKDAGYIKVDKSYKDNYPLTTCRITEKGMEAFENYLNALRSYIKPS